MPKTSDSVRPRRTSTFTRPPKIVVPISKTVEIHPVNGTNASSKRTQTGTMTPTF